MSGTPASVAPSVGGACVQWAETMSTPVGRGSAVAQAASSATHNGSSSSGGAPCPRKMAGMRPSICAAVASSVTVAAALEIASSSSSCFRGQASSLTMLLSVLHGAAGDRGP